MTASKALSRFASRLRDRVAYWESTMRYIATSPGPDKPTWTTLNDELDGFSLELFASQFRHNEAYRRVCEARGVTPKSINHWKEIPAVPTAAFKELELSCLPPRKRTHVFYSSGTTGHTPSRHIHGDDSLVLYEDALFPWFSTHLIPERFSESSEGQKSKLRLVLLTPKPEAVPHSSLVHMFDRIRIELSSAKWEYFANETDDGWRVDCEGVIEALKGACSSGDRVMLLGTAFSFVHLLDSMAEENLKLDLPRGSRVLETGGYKGRSREIPKNELHSLITSRLGIPATHIVCEYGMSELSSQAYDHVIPTTGRDAQGRIHEPRLFRFPPWARTQIISPETGAEVRDGEIGLIRVYDLANVYSVMGVQTEDLGIRRGDGFELVGRTVTAEPRGCSLQAI